MAFIYRYEIEKRDLRDSIDLGDYRDEISRLVKDFFNIEYRSILKDVKVSRDYLEYRLHLGPDESILMDLNMRIEMLLIYKLNKKDIKLKRLKNRYIGFIQEEYIGKDYEKITSIELIDYEDCQKLENVKDIKDIDVFSLRFKDRDMTYFFSDGDEFSDLVDDRYLIVEGSSGNNFNYPKLTSFVDKNFLKKYKEVDKEIYGHKNNLIRNFNIKDIRKARKDEVSNIESIKKLFRELDRSIAVLDRDYLKDKYRREDIDGFITYDRGQALCSSVYNVDKEVEIYFDMGIDKNLDILNYKNKVELDRGKTVILSHIHLDHWHMLNLDIDAFCHDYIVPNQEKGFLFSKRCEEIRDEGYSVKYIDRNIDLDFGKIYIGIELDKGRVLKHKHETGLYIVLYIKNKKILLSGDQRYECMEIIEDIDILVASHHGGEYSEDGIGDIKDIPLGENQDCLVVYSYGENNPYGHPNKRMDHISRGWKLEHHTPKDGVYIL